MMCRNLYAKRMENMKKSAIREILKIANYKEVISFAGGLPRAQLFPVDDMKEICLAVLGEEGEEALQYCATEGYKPLREWIASQYREQYDLEVSHDNILITNGSQQGLDLLGKVFLDEGDGVIIEEPGYLGAIQALSAYEPSFLPVTLEGDGIHMDGLRTRLKKKPKFFYCVPDFQNPTGISYSQEKRREMASLIDQSDTLLIEDNPYGQLRFQGREHKPIGGYMKRPSIQLGSFSKIISPGLRIGWVCAEKEIMEKLVAVKQGADLHTNHLSQRIIYGYLGSGKLEGHVAKIREAYKKQKDIMLEACSHYLPTNTTYTQPEGGMFLWVTLPERISSRALFQKAIEAGVAFVPGEVFYTGAGGKHSLRLNFSNASVNDIKRGIERLGKIIKRKLI